MAQVIGLALGASGAFGLLSLAQPAPSPPVPASQAPTPPPFVAMLDDGSLVYVLAPQIALHMPPLSAGAGVPHVTLSRLPGAAGPTDVQTLGVPFELSATDPATGQTLVSFSPPLTLAYQVSVQELAASSGDLSHLKLAYEHGARWAAAPCSLGQAGVLSCTLVSLARFALVTAPAVIPPLDVDVPGGHVFKQANGFDGGGASGFLVLDDGQARLWSEFQRLGGVDRLGYPVSGRFQFQGFWTQAFQKLVLQWRPELEQAVPLNVLDELSRRQLDAWLDANRQVPPAAGAPGDASLLDPYPELRDFYASDPDRYGLPLAVKDYGPFVAVRLQRAALQLWRDPDGPRVVVGNAGDLAKEVGLWPADAVLPAPISP